MRLLLYLHFVGSISLKQVIRLELELLVAVIALSFASQSCILMRFSELGDTFVEVITCGLYAVPVVTQSNWLSVFCNFVTSRVKRVDRPFTEQNLGCVKFEFCPTDHVHWIIRKG